MAGRLRIVAGVLAVGLLVVLARLVHLTVVEGDSLAQRAAGQHRKRVTVQPYRGAIVDRNDRLLAFSVGAQSLFVHPQKLPADIDVTIPIMAEQLSLSVQQVKHTLHSSTPFVWLKRGVSPREADRVKALGLSGIDSEETQRRVYPHGSLAAPLLGFADVDARGLAGVEYAYDQYLHGKAARTLGERDALGRTIFIHGSPQRPDALQARLTLDARLQYLAERELGRAVQMSGARAGTVLILDPRTFAVLALAQVPTFDPHTPGDSAPDARRNQAISDCYEPGSTLKALLVAAALDSGQVRLQDRIFCEYGGYRVGRHTIHDVHPYGDLSVGQILIKSSNIGAAKIGQRLGKELYYQYLQGFGLGQKTGVDLPGESTGILPALRNWSRIKLVTASFGQGVAVTPLQLASAYAVLANDGMLMRPYVVSEILNAKGDVVHANSPLRLRQVIRPDTARKMLALLEHVVEPGGTGWRAQIEGFRVAGKTGTSQKVDPHGGYSAKGRIASFIGIVPADRPQLVILVVIDEPQTAVYGGTVAAPVFQTIAQQALAQLGIVGSQEQRGGVQWARTERARIERARIERVRAQRPSSILPHAPVSLGDRGGPGGQSEQGGQGRRAEKQATLLPGQRDGRNFIGLSLREAMRTASQSDLRVVANGSGYVMRQVLRTDPPEEPVYELTLETGW